MFSDDSTRFYQLVYTPDHSAPGCADLVGQLVKSDLAESIQAVVPRPQERQVIQDFPVGTAGRRGMRVRPGPALPAVRIRWQEVGFHARLPRH